MAFTQRVQIHVIILNTRTHIHPNPSKLFWAGAWTLHAQCVYFVLRNCLLRTQNWFLSKMGKQLNFEVLKLIKNDQTDNELPVQEM